MNKIIISGENNPYYNIALEKELFENVGDDESILYLWQNEKTVVVGRNQNPFMECNVEKIISDGGYIARRVSGGGAVYHDLGNLNFTFISSVQDSDIAKQIEIIKAAVLKFGIISEASGRNDILTNGKKFSGHAFYEEDGKSFHHGTLMLDVDTDYLVSILKPSSLKLNSKGIASVKQRVINLKDINKDITVSSMCEALKESFEQTYGKASSIQRYTLEVHKPKYYDDFKSEQWIFGESPEYDLIKEEKLAQGNFQFCLNVRDGIISSAKIYTDSISDIDISRIENLIKDTYFHDFNNTIKDIFR
ncbi:MAG: lipoate--protein ligase [Proteocatella sp.]